LNRNFGVTFLLDNFSCPTYFASLILFLFLFLFLFLKPEDIWGTAGSSTTPFSEVYCGTGPFSESETKSEAEFISALKDFSAFVSLHSYGNQVIFPHQHTLVHSLFAWVINQTQKQKTKN